METNKKRTTKSRGLLNIGVDTKVCYLAGII